MQRHNRTLVIIFVVLFGLFALWEISAINANDADVTHGQPSAMTQDYLIGSQVCSDAEQLYAEAGTRSDAVAARWYGEGIAEEQRADSVRGCLAALRNQP